MKKNKMMRAASFLLVAVLLTTSVISGTFAKYVTTATGSDTARVAKWGVTVTANGSTFAQEYATDDNNVVGAIAKSVVSTDTDKLVAPGTKGNMVAMTLAGIPEVAVNVKYEAALTLSGWSVDGGGTKYCPIAITVGAETFKIGDNAADIAELETKVEAAIAAYSKDYAPHTDLSVESAVATPDVSWTWDFEGNDDVKDTFLGNQAANGNASTIELTVTTTVTQID